MVNSCVVEEPNNGEWLKIAMQFMVVDNGQWLITDGSYTNNGQWLIMDNDQWLIIMASS